MQFTINITRGHLMSTAKIITLGLLLGLGIQFLFAWTAPSGAAPTGNVAGPLTAGPIALYQTRAAGLGLAGSVNVTNIITGGVGTDHKVTTPKLCLNNDGTDTNCITSWPEDDGSSNTSQSSPSYGGVIAPGELDGSFCKTETFPTPFGKAPNVIVSLSGSDYEQWSATYSNVTPTSVKICGKMIKPPACSTDGWCLDAVAIAPTGIQWLAVGSGPETKSAVASLHFPEQRWVGERTIPIASFGYTGPAIKRSDIQKITIRDTSWGVKSPVTMNPTVEYWMQYAGPGIGSLKVTGNYNNYDSATCPAYVRGLLSAGGVAYNNHSENIAYKAVFNGSDELTGIAMKSCSPDNSGGAGIGATMGFKLEVELTSGQKWLYF